MSRPAALKRREILEAERDSLLIEREISLLKEAEKHRLNETVGEYIDPRWILQDPALNASALVPASFIGDRRGGMNWPIFQTEWELNTIRGACRLLADTSSDSQAMIEALANYVVGKGFTYKAVPRPEQTVGPRTLRKAQQVIAEFVEDNCYWELERELFIRDMRDGEDFLWIIPQDAGHSTVRTIEPEYCTEAGRNYADPLEFGTESTDDPASSWMFGVHTVGDDTTEVLGYNVYLDAYHGADYLTAAEVVHTKSNVDRIIKRGLSDFYPLTQTIDQARKLRRNMADGAALQASIAFIRQFQKGTQQGAIQAFNSQKTDFSVARYSINQPGQMSNVQRMESGRIINTPEGTEYKYGPMGNSNAPNFQLILKTVLQAIAARWNAPEGIASGDYSNNSFASALVAESPFALTVAHRQQQQGNRHRKVMLKILKIAAHAGRFNRLGLSWSDLKHLIDIQAVPTAAIGRDKKAETERRSVLNAAGILSKATWQAEEGYDEAEKAKVEQEREEAQVDPTSAEANQPVVGMRGQGQQATNQVGGQGGGARYLGRQPERPEGMKGQMPWLGDSQRRMAESEATVAREIIRPNRGPDGLFVQPDDNSPEREVAEQHNRDRFANHFHYADEFTGNTRTFDPKGDYNCGRCNMATGDKCLLVKALTINRDAGSCGDWEDKCAGDSEMPLGEKTIETAGYGVAANGKGFGCHRCPFASRALQPDSQGRDLYCGKGDMRVYSLACCGLNGAEVLPIDDNGNVKSYADRQSTDESDGNPNHDTGNGQFTSGGGSGGLKKSGKLTITKAADALKQHGFTLHGGATYDTQAKQARYRVEQPDGKTVLMSSGDIKSLLGKLHGAAKAVANLPDKIAGAANSAADKVIGFRQAHDPFGESLNESTSRAALAASLATCDELPEATRAVLKDFIGNTP